MGKNIVVLEDDYALWEPVLLKVFPKPEYTLENRPSLDNYGDYSRIDLVLSDYFLKGKDFTGAGQVKKYIKSKDSQIPVVFWTASESPDIFRELSIGDMIFFKKKIKLKEFKKEIDKLIVERKSKKDYPIYNNYFSNR